MYDKLKTIAEDLGCKDIVAEISRIEARSNQENANLILPLVGEFSSGKTTLINALTDSKKLETATKPTTATIYEVHFCSDSCHAQVMDEAGKFTEISNIEDLKNDALTDAKVVTVFDTSKKVPSSTILVDTPGLSSPDPKHKKTLVDFLPLADGILLVIDINQQITRSLTDFVELMKLSKRPIYLVLTKADGKAPSEVDAAKKYIGENCKIPLKQVVAVSARDGKLDEFYSLLDNVQKDKKKIIEQVDALRMKNIAQTLSKFIDELMRASSSNEDLEEAIRESKYELDRLNRNIDRLANDVSDDIDTQTRSTSRAFEDKVYSSLCTMLANKSSNFNEEASATVNSVASLMMSDYKDRINTVLLDNARNRRNSDKDLPLHSLQTIDLSSVQSSEYGFDLDLENIGHEYDSAITTGVNTVFSLIGNATGASGVTDIATKFTAFVVSFATENLMSKPQREHAVRNYISVTLAPAFKDNLRLISSGLVNQVRNRLLQEASETIGQKTDALEQLKSEMSQKKSDFQQKMARYKEYKSILSNI